MKKMYLTEERRNEEEKRTGKASYRTLVDRYIDDLVLCNNLPSIDDSIFYNIQVGEIDENTEIFQYYLCNINTWDIDSLKELTENNNDIIISYSDLLECDVLMVDHFGTSWDYVPTSIELTNDIEEVL